MSSRVVMASVAAIGALSLAAVSLPKALRHSTPVAVVPASPKPSPSTPSPVRFSPSPLTTPMSVLTAPTPGAPACSARNLVATARASQTRVAPGAGVELTSVLTNRGSSPCSLWTMSTVDIHVGSDPVPSSVAPAPAVLEPGGTATWSSQWTVARCTATSCRPAPPGPYTIRVVWNNGLASATVVLDVLDISPEPLPTYQPGSA